MRNLLKTKYFNSKTFLKESFLVSTTEYLMLGVVFIINILLSRFYHLGDVGVFNFCYAIAQIAVLGIGSSFSLILRRDITLRSNKLKKYIATVIKLRGILLLLILLIILPISLFFQSNEKNIFIYLLLLIVSKGLDSFSETYYTAYQSIKLYKTYTVIKTINALFTLLSVAACCFWRLDVIYIYISLLGSSLIFYILNFLYSNSGIISFTNDNEYVTSNSLEKYFLRESWPLIINAIFFQVSSRIPVVIIFALMGKYSAGIFSIGLTLVTIFTASSNAIGIVLFPQLNKLYHESARALWSYIRKVIIYMLILGTLIYVIFMVLFPFIKTFFGNIPPTSNEIFFIMGASIPFIFILGAIGNIFTIIHQQKIWMWISLLILLFNLINLWLLLHFFNQIGFAIAYSLGNFIQIIIVLLVSYVLIEKKSTAK